MSGIDWESIGAKLEKYSNYTKFIKLYGPSSKCTIRLVGNPICFNRLFMMNYKIKTIAIDPDICIPLVSALGGYGLNPSVVKRYAINVLSMEPGGYELKIFEGGRSIFDRFKQDWSLSYPDPSGSIAPVWNVKASGTGINRRYSVMPMEIHYLAKKYLTADDKVDMSKLYDLDAECKVFHSADLVMKHLGFVDEIQCAEINDNDNTELHSTSRFCGFLDGMDECEI